MCWEEAWPRCTEACTRKEVGSTRGQILDCSEKKYINAYVWKAGLLPRKHHQEFSCLNFLYPHYLVWTEDPRNWNLLFRGAAHTYKLLPRLVQPRFLHLCKESLIFHSLSTSLWLQRWLLVNVPTDNHTCSASYSILCGFNRHEICYNGTLYKTRRFLYGKALWVKSSLQRLENRLWPRCPQKMLS